MKKTICLCLTLAMMTVVFSGCQQTPEAPIVVGKDNSRMIETAKATPAPEATDMTLAERYGIPSELEFALTGAEGKLNITVDAAIDAPENPFYKDAVFDTNRKSLLRHISAEKGLK